MGNKLIVVSGGTKGIGRAIIEQFAKHGFEVATCSRGESELLALKSSIESEYGTKLHTHKADMSQKEQVLGFAEFISQINCPVDVLVNNTGVFLPGQISSEPDGTLEQMIETNLYSAYHLTRALLPAMMAKKEGYIFNICSIASFMAYPNGGSYSISKFAMLGMSKVLREELKPYGIRVSSVMPGATFTASWDGSGVPEERMSKASDVAEVVYAAYALSPQSVVEEIVIRPQLGDL